MTSAAFFGNNVIRNVFDVGGSFFLYVYFYFVRRSLAEFIIDIYIFENS